MTLPNIGFIGMTHLGLVSGVSAAEKGFDVICYDPDKNLIANINELKLPISEPKIENLIRKNSKQIRFTSECSELKKCDVVFVAPDVATDDSGQSDLLSINNLLDIAFSETRPNAVIVILSQVPPGYTRSKQRSGKILYYQVETLIFGQAVDRALYPERFIVGSADPKQAIPEYYHSFLKKYDCPLLIMGYESAELAKISINMCLVASVSTANTLAELCEKIGADWSEIIPALKLDKRIGPYSYLLPGLGIAGGNLERDLATVCNFADHHGTDVGVVRAWLLNSKLRKNWASTILRQNLLVNKKDPLVAIWGLAYKENTHSTKNSPSLATIAQLQDIRLQIYDPVVSWNESWHSKTKFCRSLMDAIDKVDALIIMTPWPEFKQICLNEILERMKGKLIIDPFSMVKVSDPLNFDVDLYTLGRPPIKHLMNSTKLQKNA